MPPGDLEGPTTILRVTTDRGRARDWALVLESGGIPYQMDERAWGVEIGVGTAHALRAAGALAAFDREVAEAARPAPTAAPDRGPSLAGLGAGVFLLAAYALAGGAEDGGRASLFAQGAAVAELIVRGELWRAVTALTLHANVAHVAGNAVAAFIFVGALGRWLGTGTALLITVAGGGLGNVVTALATGRGHTSIGASTATFAALGALGALQIVRRFRPWGRRGIWAAAGATLGLLAMLGVGSGEVVRHVGNGIGPALVPATRVDVVAHLCGLGVGALLGFLAARHAPVRRAVDAAWGLLAVALVAGAWLLAVRP